jgi:hypothetical protein
MTKDGYRFIQVLIPAKTHKNLTDKSRKLHQSNAETVRNAIDAYLSNKNVKNLSEEGRN